MRFGLILPTYLPQASVSGIERAVAGERRREFDAQELLIFSLVFDLPTGSWAVRADGFPAGYGSADSTIAVKGPASLALSVNRHPDLAVAAEGLSEGTRVIPGVLITRTGRVRSYTDVGAAQRCAE